LHAHPDEQKKHELEQQQLKEQMRKEKESQPGITEKISKGVEGKKIQLQQAGSDTKEVAEENAIAARLWTAEKLGQIQNTVKPEEKKDEEEPKTIGGRIQNVAGKITGGIHDKLMEFQAGDDPHEDPTLNHEKISNDLIETKPRIDSKKN
jgi:hypothetical protein